MLLDVACRGAERCRKMDGRMAKICACVFTRVMYVRWVEELSQAGLLPDG